MKTKEKNRFNCNLKIRVDHNLNISLYGITYALYHSIKCEIILNKNCTSRNNLLFKSKTIKQVVSKLVETNLTIMKEIKRSASKKCYLNKSYAFSFLLTGFKLNYASLKWSYYCFVSFFFRKIISYS